MFNLTVDAAHTFYVGTQGWLVHNCPDAGDDDFSKLLEDFLDPDSIASKKGLGRSEPPKAGFDWNSAAKANIDHVAKDGVTVEEWEDAFLDPLAKPLDAYKAKDGTTRYARQGKTQKGKIITLIYEVGADGAIHPVTAITQRTKK